MKCKTEEPRNDAREILESALGASGQGDAPVSAPSLDGHLGKPQNWSEFQRRPWEAAKEGRQVLSRRESLLRHL